MAIGASALLLTVAACSSDGDDPTGEPAIDTAMEPTVDDTGALVADTPNETTATPSPDGTVADDAGADGARVGDPATTEPAVVVPEALQFTAPLVGGGTFDGPALAGKPTVFWFWAPT